MARFDRKEWHYQTEIHNQQVLAAKLDYVSGIAVFDEILDGKTLKEIDAVIHLEKYPKGLLFKIARGFGGIKTHPFPVAKNEIKQVVLAESTESSGKLTFDLTDGNKIEFDIKKGKLWEVKDFFKEIKLNYEIEKTKKPVIPTEKKPVSTQKHGVPTLISFFVPGVGQLIKGHIMKAIGIWVIGGLVGFFLWWTFIAPFIVWVWNVYDAYNSNADWGAGDARALTAVLASFGALASCGAKICELAFGSYSTNFGRAFGHSLLPPKAAGLQSLPFAVTS